MAGVAATFNADFRHDHKPPTRGVVPKGPQLVWSPGAQRPLVKLIGSARPGTTLYAEDEQLDSAAVEQALIAAARRGVTVNLTMTENPDWTTTLNTLVAGGVHVSLYAPTAPIYIQSKGISVNGRTAYVSSINFTRAMMQADRNMGIITGDPTVVAASPRRWPATSPEPPRTELRRTTKNVPACRREVRRLRPESNRWWRS